MGIINTITNWVILIHTIPLFKIKKIMEKEFEYITCSECSFDLLNYNKELLEHYCINNKIK